MRLFRQDWVIGSKGYDVSARLSPRLCAARPQRSEGTMEGEFRIPLGIAVDAHGRVSVTEAKPHMCTMVHHV